MKLERLSALIILICVAIAAMAQEKVTISGTVTDRDGDPIELATVRIAGTAVGTTTGLDGKYSLTTETADTVKIVFTYLGFKEVTRELENPVGEVNVSVRMSPTSLELDAVEVTDYRKQTSQMQSVASTDYRLAADASGGSVESMISTIAGVASNNEMSSQYSVRGGTYDENLVYINGTEAFRPQLVTSGEQEGLSIINPAMVESVQFSTGGFDVSYGDRMSSVLDITYRRPKRFEGEIMASLMGGSLAIGQATKHFSQLHGLRYKRNSSLLSSMDSQGEYRPNFLDYQASLTFDFNERWKAGVLANVAVNNYTFIPASRMTSFGTSTDAKQFKVFFDGQEKDRFETFSAATHLTYTHDRGTYLTLQAGGFLTNELVTYDISGEYWLDQAGTTGKPGENDGIGGELGVGRYHEHARNRLRISVFQAALKGGISLNNHNLSYGIDLAQQSTHDRTREWELRDSAGHSLPALPDALRMIYNLTSRQDFDMTRFSFHAMDTWRIQAPSGYWNVSAGLRGTYLSFNKEFLLSPRMSVAFVPDRCPSLTMRFATGLYYQAPYYKEFRRIVTDDLGNSTVTLNRDIKSQRSLQFILGGDYTFRAMERPFRLSAEAYYKKLDNLIPYEIDNLKITYAGENLTSGYTMGLDLRLFGQFVPGSDSWISFSLMKTDELLNGVHVPRPTDRRYGIALFFTDYFPKVPRLKFSLRGILNDGLPTTPPRSSRDKGYFRAPAYKRVDVGLNYALVQAPADGYTPRRLIKEAWLGVDVFNLLDISNVSSYYWVTDVNNIRYAVPNYLTRRQFNVHLTLSF